MDLKFTRRLRLGSRAGALFRKDCTRKKAVQVGWQNPCYA
jgi:hypothetical protein